MNRAIVDQMSFRITRKPAKLGPFSHQAGPGNDAAFAKSISRWLAIAVFITFGVTGSSSCLSAQPSLVLSEPLTLTSSGGQIHGRFTVANNGSAAATLTQVFTAVRVDATESNYDLPSHQVALNPGQTYTYSEYRTDVSGFATAWAAIQFQNTWIELGPHLIYDGGKNCQPTLGQFGGGVRPGSCYLWFDPKSPFNTPIPPNPPLLANSSVKVQHLLNGDFSTQLHPDYITASADGTSGFTPVYFSRTSDPIYTVHCTPPDPSWGTCSVEGKQVRVPIGAMTQHPTDMHITIVDQSVVPALIYDLWQAQGFPLPPGGNAPLNISWGGYSRPTGMGIAEGLNGDGNAAHFSDLAGLVRAEELANGYIPHALALVIPCDNGTFVQPALGHGTTCGSTQYALPMGARLQLNMSSDAIESLPIARWRKTFLHAFATFGAFVQDTGTDGWWNFQYECGNEYSSLGFSDQLYTFAQLNNWTPFGDSLVGHWDNNSDGIDWRNTVWSHLQVVSDSLSKIN